MNSYPSENALINHKEKCGEDNISTKRTSPDSHIYWKNHFHNNPVCFRIFADFEANKEYEGGVFGNKTTNFYKQNAVIKGYYIISELEDVLKSRY